MFNIFKNKKTAIIKNIDEGQEFCFVWYKKIKSGATIHYTAPFKTSIKAKTREEAVKKLTDFVLQAMTLVIVDENKYKKEDISILTKKMNNLQKEIDNFFNKNE